MSHDFAKQDDAELKKSWKGPEHIPAPLVTARDRLSESAITTLWAAVFIAHFLLAPLAYLVLCCALGLALPYQGVVTLCIGFLWGLLLWLKCMKAKSQ